MTPAARLRSRTGTSTGPGTNCALKYPADFAVGPAAARAWREREIGDCLHDGNFPAAELHYWWLVAEMARDGRAAGPAGK
jgi:hypothetical protein